KLPMKKRYTETLACLERLRETASRPLQVRCRQLYHDREEVTVLALPLPRPGAASCRVPCGIARNRLTPREPALPHAGGGCGGPARGCGAAMPPQPGPS